MPYGEASLADMDAAEAAGIKVAFSMKDIFFGSHWCPEQITSRALEESYFKQRVADFRNHSALLTYYINDELSPLFVPQLLAHQQWLVDGDPNHPSWQVLCHTDMDEYMGTFDVIGTDPYPIGHGSDNHTGAPQVGAEANATVLKTDGARPVWEVIQAMNWEDYNKKLPCPTCHTPTLMESRSMAWQAVAVGANGIVFYEYTDLMRNPDVGFDVAFARLSEIATEMLALSPLLLSDARAPRPTVTDNPTWLMTRAQWAGSEPSDARKEYALFAVSDGSGGGKFKIDLSNQTIFECTKLTVMRIMEPTPKSMNAPLAPEPKVHCRFISHGRAASI
jgi:hypothetical protein